MEKQRYYISTAIAYTSGKPHIGNTYEVVLADAIARFKRQQGYDVYFQTGTRKGRVRLTATASSHFKYFLSYEKIYPSSVSAIIPAKQF